VSSSFSDVSVDRDEASVAADDVPSDLSASPPPSAQAGAAVGGAPAALATERRALSATRLDSVREVEQPVSRQAAPVTTQDVIGRDADVARRAVAEQQLTAGISAEPAAPAAGGDGAAAADRSSAEEGVSLVVPDLEVIAVLPVGGGSTFAGVRALQRLETGDTLEVVHLPDGVEPSSLAPLRAGWSEIVRRRGSGWLVMRARLPEPSLVELLQRLEIGR
jgi:hypothetical protein